MQNKFQQKILVENELAEFDARPVTKYPFETEPQMVITNTLSTIPNYEVLAMIRGIDTGTIKTEKICECCLTNAEQIFSKFQTWWPIQCRARGVFGSHVTTRDNA
jgi:hypothetical protein